MTTERYLTDADWTELSNFIAARPSLCDALGINSMTMSGRPGRDEMIDFLGGQLGIYSDRYEAVFAAENAKMDPA